MQFPRVSVELSFITPYALDEICQRLSNLYDCQVLKLSLKCKRIWNLTILLTVIQYESDLRLQYRIV